MRIEEVIRIVEYESKECGFLLFPSECGDEVFEIMVHWAESDDRSDNQR